MRWSLIVVALVLTGCPTPSTPGTDAAVVDANGDALPRPDAEGHDALPLDGDAPEDAMVPDAGPQDGGLVLVRGGVHPTAQEARGRNTVLRAHLSVTTTTRARSRPHVIEGGLVPLSY